MSVEENKKENVETKSAEEVFEVPNVEERGPEEKIVGYDAPKSKHSKNKDADDEDKKAVSKKKKEKKSSKKEGKKKSNKKKKKADFKDSLKGKSMDDLKKMLDSENMSREEARIINRFMKQLARDLKLIDKGIIYEGEDGQFHRKRRGIRRFFGAIGDFFKWIAKKIKGLFVKDDEKKSKKKDKKKAKAKKSNKKDKKKSEKKTDVKPKQKKGKTVDIKYPDDAAA